MLGKLRSAFLPLRQRYIAVAGILALGTLIAALMITSKRGCSSREDVVAQVADVSMRLQLAAAQGLIKVEGLASGVKLMNEASTRYETDKDHQSYCDALYAIRTDFKLPD